MNTLLAALSISTSLENRPCVNHWGNFKFTSVGVIPSAGHPALALM